jgi:hypothetical protein
MQIIKPIFKGIPEVRHGFLNLVPCRRRCYILDLKSDVSKGESDSEISYSTPTNNWLDSWEGDLQLNLIARVVSAMIEHLITRRK